MPPMLIKIKGHSTPRKIECFLEEPFPNNINTDTNVACLIPNKIKLCKSKDKENLASHQFTNTIIINQRTKLV